MAYRFRNAEAIPHAVKRVFAEEISWAVGHLLRSKKRVEAVHEARKSIKKIRGLLSLLGPQYKTEDHYFRDAGKLLSDVRDNAVMIEVFDQLAAKHSDLDASTVKDIRTNLRHSCRKAPPEKHASSELVAVLQQAPPLALHDMPLDSLLRAMEDTYRRGRKTFKKARKDNSAESFHEFRKHVKQHWYHLRLFEHAGTAKRIEELHDLETWLGDDHNLCVLRERLSGEAETSKDRQQIRDVVAWIDEDSAALRQRALAMGERLFSEKTMGLPKRPVVTVPSQLSSAVA